MGHGYHVASTGRREARSLLFWGSPREDPGREFVARCVSNSNGFAETTRIKNVFFFFFKMIVIYEHW